MVFGLSRVKVAGLDGLDKSPDQPVKLYPGLAVAAIGTFCPLAYQFIPEGLTEPASREFVEVVKLCCVEKEAA